MQIQSLGLSSCRNLLDQRVFFSPGINLVLGRNGHGKTSLVEAIYLLAYGKSFRTSRLRDLIRWQAEEEKKNTRSYEFAVHGRFSSDNEQLEIECRLESGRRQIFLNGNKSRKGEEFYGRVPVIEFTPEDLQLVKGPPSLRRNFVDRAISIIDRSYLEQAVQYYRAVKNRNALLVKLSERGFLDKKALGPWDRAVVEHGLNVSLKRKEFIKEIEPWFQKNYLELQSSDGEQARLEYLSHFIDENGHPRQADELILNFEKSAEKDLRFKNTSFGPHRDELVIFLNSGYGFKEARSSASQGQARSLVLALKLAVARQLRQRGRDRPIFLLDDVESELDQRRRQSLYSMMLELKSQVIITSTECSEELLQMGSNCSQISLEYGAISGPAKDSFSVPDCLPQVS